MSKIWVTKSCPRCIKGNLIIDSDEDGFYESCIMCGYIKYFPMQKYKSGQKEEPKKDGRNSKK